MVFLRESSHLTHLQGNRRGKYQLANSVWEKTITPNSQLFCSLRNAPYNVIRIPSSSSVRLLFYAFQFH